jgi:acetoin utilization deacetylase AcuC-like enzyme
MRVYSHPDCLLHDPGRDHAERPSRLSAVTSALQQALPGLDWQEAPLATREQLLRVHAPALLAQVLDSEIGESLRLDPDTVMSADSPRAALLACGAVVAGVDAVLGGQTPMAFCAVRPPGHHATVDTAMGFCLFNGVAVAAAHALAEHGLERVAILDFDVHHGNGSQAIFERDPRVLYLSSHQSPLYPGTGAADETGVGNIVNEPLPPMSDGAALRAAWREHLLPVAAAFAPQLLLVSAGFDAHRLDPLAQLQAEADDYRWLGAAISALAADCCDGRVVSVLEGGYSLDALRECSVAYVSGLLDPGQSGHGSG